MGPLKKFSKSSSTPLLFSPRFGSPSIMHFLSIFRFFALPPSLFLFFPSFFFFRIPFAPLFYSLKTWEESWLCGGPYVPHFFIIYIYIYIYIYTYVLFNFKDKD